MSEKNEPFNPFDPTGMFKNMRDSSLDAWSKLMIQLVNSDVYAQATGTMLDAWLSTSTPLRKLLETTMTQVLINFQMPTRSDVTSLAERLTHIEMRLDDLEAKLDETPRGARKGAAKSKTESHSGEGRTDGH
jgi:hypothetical protein